MDLLQTFIKVGVKDEATDGVASIGAGVLAKAQLIADGIKSMASAAFSTIKDVIGGAVDAYSTYQQQTGGIETFFNQMSASGEKASDVVIANAKKAYQTAGMSANQYMENVGSFATTLIQSVAKEREQAAKGDVEAQAAALDQQLENAKASYAAQYEAQKRTNEKAAQAYSDQLSDELDALKKRLSEEVSQRQEQLSTELSQLKDSLNQQVEERKAANAEALSQTQETLSNELDQLKESLAEQLDQRKAANQQALDDRKTQLEHEYSELQRSLDQQVSAVQKSQDEEVKAYQKATDLRIKEINREYSEKLKLVDEEMYNRIKAIDDQIDALDDQTEAEREAIEKRNQNEKIASLEQKVMLAKSNEERVAAQQALSDYLEDIAQKSREKERSRQKETLQEQKQAIREEYSARKETIKESQSEELETYKEGRSEQLDAMKESNKAQIEAMKEANKQQLEQAKENNSKILEQMKAEQQAEITQIQKSNQAQIDEKTKANQQIIKDMQTQQAAEIAEMQKANQAQISERETANKQIISQMQEQNDAIVKAQQRANRDSLEDYRQAQADQLQVMKDSQTKQLEQLQDFVNQQKEALSDTGFVEATYEDQIRAAQLADMAITDMSDNANKMGTDISMIQNAYQGFAKDNFTMLDNLKLGYSGSKEGMEQLLADAEKIQEKNGNLVDYSIDSFADIVEAIHVVQREYGVSGYSVDELKQKMEDHSLTMQDYARVAQDLYPDMENLDEAIQKVKDGIEDGSITWQDATILMGTTAKEGSETIEGSFNQMQAAWENFLVALQGSDDDVNEALGQLIDSVEIWLGNITPVLTRVLENLIPIVIEKGGEIGKQLWDAIYNSIPEDQKEKFGDIIDAIKGIGDAVVELYDKKDLIFAFFAVFEGVQFVTAAKGSFDALKGAVEGVAKVLGIGGVATAAGEAASAVSGASEVVEVGGTAFKVLEGGLASTSGAAGELAGTIGSAGTAVGGTTGAFGGLAAEMAPFLGPAGIIIAAGAAILYMVGTNEELMKSIEGLVTDTDHLSSDTEIQTANMGTSWETLEQSMSTSAKDASDAVQVQTSSMTSNWSTAMSQMDTDTDNTTNALVTKLQNFAASSGTPLDEVGNKIKDMAKSGGDSFDSLNSKAGTVVTAMTDMESGSSPKIKNMGTIFGDMRKTAETALDGAKTKAKDALTEIAKTADEKGSSTSKGWKGNMESFRKATEVEINTTTQKFNGLGTTLANSAGGFSLAPQGTNIMRSFYNGMVSEWNSNITTFVQNIASWIQQHKGPEQYDKQLLVQNGEWIMEGLSNGLENGMWAVKRTIYGVGEVIGDETTSNVDGIDGNVERIMDRAVSSTKQGMGALSQTFSEGSARITSSMANVMTDIKTAIDGSLSDFEQYGQKMEVFSLTLIEEIVQNLSNGSKMLISAGRQIMDGLLEGLRSGFGNVQRFVGEIGPWIQQNKGPELYDRQLLIPNGSWIMDGLHEGLEGAFEHDVMPYVSGMGEMMRGAFGAPVLSPMASVLNRSNSVPQLMAQQSRDLTVILELDRVQFGRLVYSMNNEETQRVGVQLAGGFV